MFTTMMTTPLFTTGYPLYTIIVYFATTFGRYILPGKSPAYSVNLTSAIFGAVASGVLSSCILYLIVIKETKIYSESEMSQDVQSKKKEKKRKTTKNEGCEDSIVATIDHNYDNQISMEVYISIFVGLLHSFSPLSWQYSVTAEVFALHNLFVSLIIHTTLRFASCGRKSVMLLGAFLCGMSLTNQHISVLLVFPLILWVMHVTKLCGVFQKKNKESSMNQVHQNVSPLVLAGIYFFSGLVALYITMPIFSLLYPHPGSWGDVTSFGGFIRHLSRKDYGSLRLYSGNDNGSECAWERFLLWVKDFMWSQGFPFVGVASIIACKDALIEEIQKRRVQKGRTVQSFSKHRGMIVLSDEESIGVDTMIVLSLGFYLIVFHTLANLPLSNPLFFGIHQVCDETTIDVYPSIIQIILTHFGTEILDASKYSMFHLKWSRFEKANQ